MKELQANRTVPFEREKSTRLMETSELLQEQVFEGIAKWESQHKTFAMTDRMRDFMAASLNGRNDVFSLRIGKTKKTISLEMEEQIRGRDEA